MIPTHNIMSRKRKTLLPKLQRLAATAVQGGLSETIRTCGNPACACHQDPGRRHGPEGRAPGAGAIIQIDRTDAADNTVRQQTFNPGWRTEVRIYKSMAGLD